MFDPGEGRSRKEGGIAPVYVFNGDVLLDRVWFSVFSMLNSV